MKKKKGNFAIIVLAIVVVAIVASLIAWFISTKSQAPLGTGRQGSVYTNVEYGFQFTMPQKWMEIIADYKVQTESDDNPFVEFVAKTTDKEWQQQPGYPKGYALLFGIDIIKKTDWDQDLKTCDSSTDLCLHSFPVLGENGENVFVLMKPHASPFTMFNTAQIEAENTTDFIKGGFKLLNP